MIPAKDMKPLEGVYTFIESANGENINIASGRLFTWTKTNLIPERDASLVPVRPELGRKFLRDNVCSRARVINLMVRAMNGERLTPIIFAADETKPDAFHYLVDGHHRYVISAALKHPHILAYILKPEQWKPFQIEGLPDMTEDQLRNLEPALGRTY